MRTPRDKRWTGRFPSWRVPAIALAAWAAAVGGCKEQPEKVKSAYTPLPVRDVPDYMRGSVYQVTDMTGTEPFPVSGYGLVTNLHGTGGSRAPTPVRDYMVKELARHQVGSAGGGQSADKILGSRDFSIVRVEGYIPPGARATSTVSNSFDVRCTALPESDTTSLAHGDLWECDLKIGGANPTDPGNGMVDVKGQAVGALFVNPTYVLDTDTDTPAAKASRRSALVLAGARVMEDRPLILRLRTPERRLARAIESRIVERFQDVVDDDLQDNGNTAAKKVANAQDEARIDVYVPLKYVDHWEHFAGIVRHLYLQGNDPAFATLTARKLADAAVNDPKAPLLDISYAWEGLGKPALFALDPLMTDPALGPDVHFAAARAAAFIGDPGSVTVLIDIARTAGNPFRVNAVQTLGELPASPRVDQLCRSLLDSDQATVRIEAYKLLVRHADPSIFTRWVKDGDKEIFALDVVRTHGHEGGGGPPPLVYATQRGVPRVAVFGTETSVDLPMIFSTLEEGRLMFSSTDDGDRVSVSYRSPYRKDLVGFTSRPDLPEMIAMMGGDGNGGAAATRLHLGYGDVVAVLQALIDHRKVSGPAGDGRLAATFVLGEPSLTGRLPISTAGMIRPTAGRPASDRPGDAGSVDDGLIRNPKPVAPPVAPPPVGPPADGSTPLGTTPLGTAPVGSPTDLGPVDGR